MEQKSVKQNAKRSWRNKNVKQKSRTKSGRAPSSVSAKGHDGTKISGTKNVEDPSRQVSVV